MDKVLLNRTGRISSGHLWVFSNELASNPKDFEPGSLVEVYDKKGGFHGIGYINPHSLISVRLLTREREAIDAAFFHKRIQDAIDYRTRFLTNSDSFRVVFSEGDFLPGLIADKYSDCLSVQLLTLGMDKMRDLVLEALDKILSPSVIVLRNDSKSRTLEGLPLEKAVIKGDADHCPIIHEGGLALEVDLLSGQKTGFFLDQRENRAAFARFVGGGRGLDLFCYSGAWGLPLAKKGANVTFVDGSAAAIAITRRNSGLNDLSGSCDFVEADVFDFLRREITSGSSYDFMVLDPPAFVKSKSKIKEGLRGYKELNTLAMKLIGKGGVLATASCSYHIEKSVFAEMLQSAARDAGKHPRLLEFRSQGIDHPVLLSVPETEYLKCAFLEL